MHLYLAYQNNFRYAQIKKFIIIINIIKNKNNKAVKVHSLGSIHIQTIINKLFSLKSLIIISTKRSGGGV